MIQSVELEVKPQYYNDLAHIRQLTAVKTGIPLDRLGFVELDKRSIDARSRKAFYRIRINLYTDEDLPAGFIAGQSGPAVDLEEDTDSDDPGMLPADLRPPVRSVADGKRVIIIGAGPAGLFAALRLIEHGLKPVILDRGKSVRDRRRDLAVIHRQGVINTESNYCFGEGGAGTYSDGKLYTRSGNKDQIKAVLNLFIRFGAPADIFIDARPHIGTNKLPAIISAIRDYIIACGGEVHFDQKITGITKNSGSVRSVTTADGVIWEADNLILATGHSARDIFHLLHGAGIRIEAKAFALGVRIEHHQSLVNTIQYHSQTPDPFLPPAYYQLIEQVESRGVFSFCMCPGGIIAPCATDHGEVVVNGWSPSKRNNPYANSGTVVQVDLADIPGLDNSPLAALEFQQQVETLAFQAGGGALKAPGQRMVDFVNGKISTDLPGNSYLPGTTSVNLHEVLPGFIASRLREALPKFDRKMKGYYTNEAILVGVESRTSSPVRVPRSADDLQHPELRGLYPCGEGAGYAGGIMSAAIDGRVVADAIAQRVL